MNNKLVRAVLLVSVAAMFTSCSRPLFFDGTIKTVLYVRNLTEADFTVQYQDVLTDSISTVSFPPSSSGYHFAYYFHLDDYVGDKTDDLPSEEYFSARMERLSIFRETGGGIQFLPRSCYDKSDKFTVHKPDRKTPDYTVVYELQVTEDLFSE